MCLSGIDWDGYDEAGKGKSVAILGYTDEGQPETSDRVAEGDLGVAYSLFSHRHRHKFTVRVRVPRTAASVPTVAAVWATASWHEREAWDLVGIDFAGHPDLRRMLLEESWVGHPLRKDYQMPDQWDAVPLQGPGLQRESLPRPARPNRSARGRRSGGGMTHGHRARNIKTNRGWADQDQVPGIKSELLELNMGPQHPATHGVLRLLLQTDGEIVYKVTPVLGYLHRCAEKIAEGVNYKQWVVYTDRFDYLAPMTCNHAYVTAVEKMMQEEVPERAEHIRIAPPSCRGSPAT